LIPPMPEAIPRASLAGNLSCRRLLAQISKPSKSGS
jgi:hypothetical protein